ncbi:MAG: hotdog domain-containing protein [Candidatus Acidiferrales bacterium]
MKQPGNSRKSQAKSKSAKNPEHSSTNAASSAVSPEQRLRIGLDATVEKTVPREWTLAHYNPQLPPVLSTPAMIGMMEIAAAQAVQADLPAGAITVGTRIEVDHLKAVPEGTSVRAAARLVEHKGRFMIFEVEAKAGELVIGRGRVYRAIVEPAKFHAKAHTRKS